MNADMNKLVISFDFDDTLASETSWDGTVQTCIPLILDLLKEYHALGCECIILTARSDSEFNNREIEDYIKSFGLQDIVKKVVYTNHYPKGPFAIEHKVKLHYDDCPSQIASVRSYGIPVIDSIQALEG